MLRETFWLVLNVGINGALGFAFWVAVARLYPTELVGASAAAISAMVLVSGIGWFGWQYVLLRYLPEAGSAAGRLLGSSYAIATGVAIVAAIGLVASDLLAADVRTVLGTPWALLGLAAVWVVFSLQDPALIGLGRSVMVPLENLAFGGLKLVAIVVLASGAPAWAIVGSWVGAAAVLLVVVNVAWIRPAVRSVAGDPSRLPGRPDMGRFAVSQHVAAVATALPDSLVPLIVVASLGAVDNAHYYAAWTVAFSLRLVAVNLANVFTVQAARAPSAHPVAAELQRLTPIVIAAIVAVAIVGAEPVMALFGREYGNGVGVLRWMAIGLVPFSLVTLRIAHARVEGRSAPAILAGGLATAITISLDVLLLPNLGVVVTGVAWTIGWTVAWGAVTLTERGRPAMVPDGTTHRQKT